MGTIAGGERLRGALSQHPMVSRRRGAVPQAEQPRLRLHGEADPTDPIGQSQQSYRGLKRYGVDSDFIVYPREPHGRREEKPLLDRLNRIVAWYDKYLRPNASSTAPQ